MISAILYSTGTGSCERYAKMLSAQLHVPAKPLKGAYVREDGDVIYVSWVMNGGLAGLKQAMAKYNVKAVVHVGMSPVFDDSEAKGRAKNNIPDNVAYFVKQGGFNMSKLNPAYQVIMKLVCSKIEKQLRGKESLNPQEQALFTMVTTGKGEPAEWNVDDIVDWAKKLA